jgi:hypothetical protein
MRIQVRYKMPDGAIVYKVMELLDVEEKDLMSVNVEGAIWRRASEQADFGKLNQYLGKHWMDSCTLGEDVDEAAIRLLKQARVAFDGGESLRRIGQFIAASFPKLARQPFKIDDEAIRMIGEFAKLLDARMEEPAPLTIKMPEWRAKQLEEFWEKNEGLCGINSVARGDPAKSEHDLHRAQQEAMLEHIKSHSRLIEDEAYKAEKKRIEEMLKTAGGKVAGTPPALPKHAGFIGQDGQPKKFSDYPEKPASGCDCGSELCTYPGSFHCRKP